MLRLLFVEDEPASVEPVILHLNALKKPIECTHFGFRQLREGRSHFDCKVVGFNIAEEAFKTTQPDVVILDLVDDVGAGADKQAGSEVLKFVWASHFCPLVIYSAHEGLLAEGGWSRHPFVEFVQKGAGSEVRVESAINQFRPHIEALQKAEEAIGNVFTSAMRDVAPVAFDSFSADPERAEAILRSGRRRLAAMMDEEQIAGKLASWEAYVHPVVTRSLTIGDVLLLTKGNPADASHFRIVLTPSCDLVTTDGRKPKVDNVLVAKCIPTKDGIDAIQMATNLKRDRLLASLSAIVLTQGYYQRFIPFPLLKGRIPSMIADLKMLELLPLNEIGEGASAKYVRVASLDSPFRELISWAYLQIACRPGLPDRDFDAWVSEITDAIK